ncbi:MAG TPA: SDR family NAD(P)-dependent oxidoreductase, partial [Ilumatobacteraceae bacterium]|nr:SDR family NAD(P)-dependent oxidoreductase [Ilumatobacteraceae bacterium]
LVNNAGILRDRMIANMSEDEFDSVVRVHLRGHFCPLRHAAEYWRSQAKAGVVCDRSVVNTSSTSGLLGNVGQGNYGSAKAGIASMTIIADLELRRYGVRVNAIARRGPGSPPGWHRLLIPTRSTPGILPMCRRWWRISPPRGARCTVRFSSFTAGESN